MCFMHRFHVLLGVILVSGIVHAATATVAYAQITDLPEQKPEALPVEIALTYDYALGQVPDYDRLISLNSHVNKTENQFGHDVILKQQRKVLETLYGALGPDTILNLRKRVAFNQRDADKRTAQILTIQPDKPFEFPLTTEDVYGVFILNAKDLENITPPYVHSDFPLMLNVGTTPNRFFPAELKVRPVTADRTLFPLPDGKRVKPLLVELVEILIFTENGKRLLLQKRFKNWVPPEEAATNLQEEIMEALPEKL